MSHIKLMNTRTRFLLIAAALLVVSSSIFALREASADSLNKFGITEQSRMGKLLGKIAPHAFATKSTDTAQGEAALKLLKDRGQYASLRQAMETARYRAHAEPQRAGEFAALNPAQEFHSRFTPQGVEVRRRSDEATPKLAMTLRGVGYGERQLPVSLGTVTAQDQRIEILHTAGEQSAITEWYVNRPNGLEQGFTISEPPSGAGGRRDGERLRLTLELSGEWRAKLRADGQAMDFSEVSGASTVRYDHLVVRDAKGQTLPARMSLARRELRLEVEDAGAVWPVTIDPTISQQVYLKASNTEANDRFGSSVSVSGDTVVVGAYQEDSNATGVNGNQADNSAGFSGAVYVFVRSGVTWTQQAYLKASNTGSDDQFGKSVAVSGDTVVVGADQEDSNATGVNGNQADNSANTSGAAYVFTRSGVTWTQQAYLKASNTGAGDNFGRSVGLSGDTVIVGAWGEGSNATGVNGNQADNSASQSGAAYVFTRSGVTWTQQAYLKASNTGASDQFGWSVAVSGDTVVVGAIGEDSNATGVNGNQTDNSAALAGAAYIFTRSGVTWTQQAYLKASNTAANDNFGYSVALSGDTVVAGAYTEDGSAIDSGAAYVFTRSGVTWTQQAYLKASNPDMSDGFGISVALSGDTVVVGAHGEDSNATGVNGSQADNSASASGAAYLFTRSGVIWTQQAYLKASNSGANDWFGWSVAVSGDTVVIGALFEASNATGINGNQTDNSASSSGAAYVFAPPLNTPPGITAQAGVSRQQGSPVSNSTIATVSDAETAAGSLTVTVTSANPSNGVTLSNIVNTNGTITANILASCAATNASFTLQVSDGSNTATATLNVTVTANTVPSVTYAAASVNAGSSTTNSPTTATDNGSINGYSVQSQGTYTGTISVNSSGVVSISNAAPAGAHTITIRATDNCGATTDATFTLTVNNSPPTISAAILMRTAGAGSSNSTIASVSDADQAANTLTVQVNGAASATVNGVTVSGLSVSAGGAVTANVGAAAGAAGAEFTLTARDSANATATATFVVIVTTPACSAGSAPVWVQQAQVTASDGAQQDQLGYSVAISGDTAVVGANGADTAGGTNAGAAYVFTRSGGVWTQQQKLTASDGAQGDFFGFSVAISGDTVIVSAHTKDTAGGSDAGAAYVFTRSGGVWTQQQKLTASDGAQGDLFGFSVAISGDTAIVGAVHHDLGIITDAGAAYVFTRVGGVWNQQQKLTASDGQLDSLFGHSVAINGDTAVVGAYLQGVAGIGTNAGAAYVFTRSGGVWTQQQRLFASDGGPADNFGSSVAISGDTAVVGAINADTAGGSRAGAAYVFTRSGGVWTQQQKLTASDGTANQLFGYSVGISGDTVIVGAYRDGTTAVPDVGAAYVFTRGGGTWTEQQKIVASDGTLGDAFGFSVAISGTTAISGAFANDTAAGVNAGSAYFFNLVCNTPPTIAAQTGVSRQQGSPASNAQIATVSDTESGAAGVTVNVTSANPSNGVTISSISNSSGTMRANVAANCTASDATFTLSARDGYGTTTTTTLIVNVTANSAPTLAYGAASVVAGNSTTNSPTTATDNGSITGYTLQSQGTYTGTISVNPATGLVSISNAAPIGSHTITIRATDNCGATTDATFTLNVGNNLPTITAGAALTRQRGTAGSLSPIATVSDTETAAGSLTVTATTVPAGITITGITNAAGTISATVAADCTATIGVNTVVLTVTDGNGGTATANLAVTVTANTAPTLTYGNVSVNAGASTSNTPTTATDNGSIASYSVQSQGTYTGTISVNSSGVVSISNAAPAGNHTITIRATDNCSVTTDATFTLTVGCGAINVNPMTLSNAAVGTAYSRSLTVTPSGTYGFSVISGQLPKGLALSTGGVLSGTPSEFGIFTFTVAATQTSPGSCSGSRLYTLHVTGSNCAAPNFTDRADFTAGGGPLGIVAADFNRDGKNDMAVANENGDSVTVLLGDGIGGFSTSSTVGGLGDARFVDVGDFNGDGNPDLIAALRTGSNVAVLFGNGAGDFPTSTNVNVGFIQSSVRPGDFNGDGKLDFIAFSFGTANQLSVALGNGVGGFSIAPGSPVQMGFAASGTLNDFNKDGKLDVALARVSPAQVIVMYGDGTGALTADAPISFATNLAGIFTADFNVDGNLDLAVPHSDDSLTLLFGDGSGGFSSTADSPISGASAVAASDLNGDGIPDLVGITRVGFGDGSGGFTFLNGLNTGSDRRSGTVADLNGDGKPDLAVLNYNPNKVVVVFNNCAPQIISGTTIARQQGSPAANSQIATVSDPYDTDASLTVTATSVPSGLTVTNIVNTGGAITADVSANCAISTGPKTVVLQVSDGALTATANLTVTVTANTTPSVTYANVSVNAGGSTTNSPTAASDNGSITGYAVQSPGTYTGTISVNSSGVVSVSNAAPVGAHTITIRVTDNCNATTDATFTLTVGNNAPTITAAAALTRQRGTAGSVSTIATVNDGETVAGSLVVTATTVPAGLTVTGISNSNGTITANVAADCSATLGANTVVLAVTDGNSGTATANLTVNVTANTAPTLTYGNTSVNAGGSTTNSPTTATDNGSIMGYTVQSQGTYTGTISVNSSGVVSISSAASVGAHTITIRATDNCNATTDAIFTLTVGNNAPTITAAAALTRQRGTASSVSTIATVNDGETAAGGLIVTAMTVPAGITVNSITNTLGTITATVAADCTATLGANTVVLTVTDGNSGTATANLTVNVTANTAPTLTYGNASVNAGSSTSNSPTTATDNGSITGYAVQSQGTYTGTISVNAFGVVSISNAAPVGMHTITIRATDNCGSTTDATFTLTVGNNAPTITAAAALSRQQASTGSVSTIATVSDGETAAGSLVVTATTVPTGITVTSITNVAGTITAHVAAGCNATVGANTVVLTVTDGNSGTSTANLTVNVTANAAPTLTYAAAAVNAGASTTNTPTTATDNGSITGYTVQSQGTYTGTISVNSSGIVSISNAAPVGAHTITIRATDNCNATTDATFTLTVNNTAPTFTPAAALSRQQGSPAGLAVTIGTVADAQTDAGSLTLTQITGGTAVGITFTNIVNTNGTMTAQVSASCTATAGTVRFQVSDGSLTGTGDLQINVTLNIAPTLTYAAAAVSAGSSTTSSPTAATDNGSISSYAVQSQGTYTGTISVNSSGVVSISNAAPVGAHTITIRATDNCGAPTGVTDATFTLTVSCPAITLSPGSLLGGTIGLAYNQTVSATPAGTYSFAVTSGALPTGLTLNASSGAITGTPSQTGTATFTITATGSGSCTGSQSYSIAVTCPDITLAPTSLPNGTNGTAYNQTVSATPTGTYSFAVTSGALPTGLTLNAATGAITGTPTASGVFNFRITATGSGAFSSCSGFRDYSVTIACGTVTLNPANLPNGALGTAYNQTVSATPADSYSFAVTLGSLPSGLTLNAATGAITGTPTASGAFNFTITATAGACSGSRQYAMDVACATITLPALANATAGNAYSQSVAATPSGTYTYSLTQGSLPSGLSLNAQSGLLSGMPTVTGSYNFTIKAQAASGCSGTQAYTFTVNCPTVTLTPASLPAGSTGTSYSQTLSASPAGGNYSYAVTTGTLPAGLSLNPATGVLSGTPTLSGTSNFTITATGFGGCAGSKAYSITIGGGCPTITLPDLPSGSIGQMYSQSVTASPAGSYSYSQTGSLPPGLTLYATGLLFGYPSATGTYNFTITATGSNNCTGSKSYNLVIGGGGFARAVFGDFDGDGKTDFSVWRGQQSDWLIIKSSDSKLQTAQWGAQYDPYNDVIAPGDYDGDGKYDVAVFRRATGQWLIKCSQDGAVMTEAWGLATDTPVPADYDGDGKTDIAVWRGAETNWYIMQSSDHQERIVSWGTSNAPYHDVPVPADYDGDGKTDIAVFRQSNGHWYIRRSSDGQVIDKHWGLWTDVPVVADYDGDGKADVAVWRGSEGRWYVSRSSGGDSISELWGAAELGDVPVPGDYDGDGKTDLAVWRPSTGIWYVKGGLDASDIAKTHGARGDTPVTSKSR
jgi:hypothetical protein